MADEKKTGLSEEFLSKFKHRSGYIISETPRYRPLVSSNEEFDEVPVLTSEAGEQEEPEKPEGEVPVAPSNDQPQNADAPAQPETPVPAFDAEAGGEVPPEGEMTDPMGEPVDPMADPMGAPEPENQVDDIQNEIIKHNIEAMKGIRDQLQGLDSTLQGLNSKMDVLNADVEEVREPTDGEKLMNKTDVSYPYYLNLNDMWQDNWFDQKRAQEQNGGIRELPDGTYVADFDDLPQKSKIDIQDTFNAI